VVVVWTVFVRVLSRRSLATVAVIVVMRNSAPEGIRHESDALGGTAR
jgi:hypothetical protein